MKPPLVIPQAKRYVAIDKKYIFIETKVIYDLT